jgi:hypothetical protein
MEDPVFEQPNIRRRDDGSIDIDFYRQAALMERCLVMTDFARGVRKVHRAVIAVLLLAAAFYMAPSRDGAAWDEASAISARHNNATLKPHSTSAQLYAFRTVP